MDAAGKRAPKLGNLPSLTVIRPKIAKILLHKVAKLYRRLYGGGGTNPPLFPLLSFAWSQLTWCYTDSYPLACKRVG